MSVISGIARINRNRYSVSPPQIHNHSCEISLRVNLNAYIQIPERDGVVLVQEGPRTVSCSILVKVEQSMIPPGQSDSANLVKKHGAGGATAGGSPVCSSRMLDTFFLSLYEVSQLDSRGLWTHGSVIGLDSSCEFQHGSNL